MFPQKNYLAIVLKLKTIFKKTLNAFKNNNLKGIHAYNIYDWTHYTSKYSNVRYKI